jgi:hypothetical protein
MSGCKLKKKDKKEHHHELVMLVYGLPDFEKQLTETVIAKQYGFKFKTVGGCMVSDWLRDSVETNNRITENILAERYGNEWKFRFYHDVDNLYAKQLRFVSKFSQFD